jgi:hypothetical protein
MWRNIDGLEEEASVEKMVGKYDWKKEGEKKREWEEKGQRQCVHTTGLRSIVAKRWCSGW